MYILYVLLTAILVVSQGYHVPTTLPPTTLIIYDFSTMDAEETSPEIAVDFGTTPEGEEDTSPNIIIDPGFSTPDASTTDFFALDKVHETTTPQIIVDTMTPESPDSTSPLIVIDPGFTTQEDNLLPVCPLFQELKQELCRLLDDESQSFYTEDQKFCACPPEAECQRRNVPDSLNIGYTKTIFLCDRQRSNDVEWKDMTMGLLRKKLEDYLGDKNETSPAN